MLALLKPGDTIMGMSLAAGGHLDARRAAQPVGQVVQRACLTACAARMQRIDYDEVERLARGTKPEAASSPAARPIRASSTSRASAASPTRSAPIFMVDMAHFAGLVAGGAHPSPLPHAHVVTTTTHKTLRGPRGGMILCQRRGDRQEDQLGGLPRPAGRPADACHRRQGGVLRRGAAAGVQALCARRRRQREDRWPRRLVDRGLAIVSGGTDTHLMLVDLRPKKLTGKAAESALERAGITCNKNGIPFDPEKPTVTSGVRLGTPGGTTRGFGPAEFRQIGELIAEVLDGLARQWRRQRAVEAAVRRKVRSALRALSDLSAAEALRRAGGEATHALSVLRQPRIRRSRIRGRPRITPRSAGGGSAPIAARASPPSSACSCASSRSSRRTASASPSIATSSRARSRSRCASARSSPSASSA